MPTEYTGPLYRAKDRVTNQAHQLDAGTRGAIAQRQREMMAEALDGDADDVKRYGPAATTSLGLVDFFFRGEGWRTAVGGVRDAIQETLNTAEEFRQLTGNIQEKLLEAVGAPEQFAKLLEPDLELPEVEDPESAIGKGVRPAISFLAGALPINRGMKAAGLAQQFTRDVLSAAGAGALTVPDGFFTLADQLAEVPGLEKVIPDFLRSDPGDTAAEAKLKRGLNEALGVGIGTAILRPTIAALKFARAGSALRTMAGATGTAFAKLREAAPARIQTYWKNNLVSGVATQVLNAGTNMVNTALVPLERVGATTLTRGMRAGFTEARATIYGLAQGIEDTFRLARSVGTVPGEVLTGRAAYEVSSDPGVAGTFFRSFVTGKGITDPRFTKLDPESVAGFVEPPDLRTIMNGGPLAKLANAFDYFLTSGGTGVTGTRGLITSDEIFKTPLHRMELWRRAAQEGMELGFEGEDLWRYIKDAALNPSDDALKGALEVAQYGTFTRPLGPIGQKLIALRDAVPAGLGHAVFPFVSTPSNIFRWGFVERTPLGLLFPSIRAELTSPDQMTRTLAGMRIAYGSGLILMAAKWAAEGRLTGGGPVDPEMRQLMHGDRPPYSVLLGDHWVQLQRAAPWGTVLGLGADLYGIAGHVSAADYQKMWGATVASIYRNTLDFPFTQGFSDLADLIVRGVKEGDPKTLGRFGGDIIATFLTPRTVAQYARAIEPVARSARTVMDRIRSQVAGYREDLPVMHDALGDEVLPNEGWGDGVLGVFSRLTVPLVVRRNEDRFRDVRDFLVRFDVDIGMPQRQIGGVPIDERTHQERVRRSGQIAVPEVRRFMHSGAWTGMTRQQVEREVRRIFATARGQAGREALARDPVLASRVDRVSAGVLEREDASMQRSMLEGLPFGPPAELPR